MDEAKLRALKNVHFASHDPDTDPMPTCPFCVSESWRATHRCFGDGSSTGTAPPKRAENAAEKARRKDLGTKASLDECIKPLPSPGGVPLVKAIEEP